MRLSFFAPLFIFLATALAANAAVTPDGNAKRETIPDTYKWNLDQLFENDAAFETQLGTLDGEIEKLLKFKGKLKNPKKLYLCLDHYFKTRLTINKLTLYTNLRFDTYQSDNKIQALNDKAQVGLKRFMTASTFIREEILALPKRKIKSAYRKVKKLKEYSDYIDELQRRKDRVLSPDAERVLALAGDNLWAEIDLNEIPSDFEKSFGAILGNLQLPKIKDEKGKSVQLTFSNYGKYRASKDRRVRKDTVDAFFNTLKNSADSLAAVYAGQINFDIFLARSRGYDTALEAYLHKDNIDPAVYKNMITAIKSNLKPLHEYISLRKKWMGLKDIHLYDLYTSLAKGVDKEIPYDKARKTIMQALQPLGSDYLRVLGDAMDPQKGWIDVYPHTGKDSGAFSASVYGLHPYVKMNYYNSLNDLSTLAHEYGHAMHSYLAMEKQSYINFNYTPFVAEIASTLNEKLLSDYLVANASSDEEKLYLLTELMESIRTTIYRQALFAEFELKAHSAAEKGTPLTAQYLSALYKNLVRQYYGPDYTIDKNNDIEWAYIPHFYYKYYVYTYATGLSSGIALAEIIQKGGEKEQQAYLDMLRGGRSKPSLELLKGAGVDLTKPDAINAAAKLFAETLEKIKALKNQGSPTGK